MTEEKINNKETLITNLEKLANDFVRANVHYGHKPREWNPKMAPYISDEKVGYHIIDLVKTSKLLKSAKNFLRGKAKKGGSFLFVGTTRAASSVVAEQASQIGGYYVNYRWLGGMLTNWCTLQKRIQRLNELENLEANKDNFHFSKKDYSAQKKEREKLRRLFGGIQEMKKLPDVVIFTNQLKDQLAIEECTKLGIPCVCIVDTNCNPDLIPFPIPANDDSPESLKLILSILVDAIRDGYNKRIK